MTVRENLLFFGRIKGIEDRLVGPVCEAFMVALNIKRYENKMIQFLSGGNRRKVSLAVALMGSPPTVYLDEVKTTYTLAIEPSFAEIVNFIMCSRWPCVLGALCVDSVSPVPAWM